MVVWAFIFSVSYGGFAGYGRQANDWGLRRGDWDQGEATLGGFLGWQADSGAWIGGQLSYTQLDIDTNRQLPIGPALRVHRGSTDGSNLTAALHGGWRMGEGALSHGPVLGLVAQRIEIDGFAESDPASSTSLAFPDQEFDSLVGSLGWQASYAINAHLAPYARLTVDREFEDGAEEAFAQSQTTGLEYGVPGPGYDDAWTTLTLGARTSLFGLDAASSQEIVNVCDWPAGHCADHRDLRRRGRRGARARPVRRDALVERFPPIQHAIIVAGDSDFIPAVDAAKAATAMPRIVPVILVIRVSLELGPAAAGGPFVFARLTPGHGPQYRPPAALATGCCPLPARPPSVAGTSNPAAGAMPMPRFDRLLITGGPLDDSLAEGTVDVMLRGLS